MNNTFPEITLARRITEKYNIEPGFDIRKFAERFIEIEEESIPYSVDALFLGFGTIGEKPYLILNSRSFYRRQRFTLAHELGHYFIPWHAGLIFCHTDPTYRLKNYLYKEMEGEANRFASELLMPASWIEQIIENNKSIEKIVKKVYRTGVSYIAANIALSHHLPPGYLFVQTDDSGYIEYSGRSKGSGVTSPGIGDVFDPDIYEKIASEYCTFESGSNQIHWFKFKRSVPKPKAKKDDRNSKEIIRSFLENIEPNESKRMRLLQQINGIIGAANSRHNFERDSELLSYLFQRFSSKEQLRFLLGKEEFKLFLSKKCEELFE